jgi:cystathionine gamma-synthase
MSTESFKSHGAPFGEAIPVTPHAVSVSMPALKDVHRLFAENDQTAWAELKAIYPRFGEQPYIQQAVELAEAEEGQVVLAMSSPEAAERLIALVPVGEMQKPDIKQEDQITFLTYTPGTPYSRRVVATNNTETGWVASSRRAEDFLVARGAIGKVHPEKAYECGARIVADALEQAYFPAKPDVLLSNSGMSAVTATVEALHTIRNQKSDIDEAGRDTWILLGHPYHDTFGLLAGRPQSKSRVINSVYDSKKLQDIVEATPDRIAGVITEAPINPLMGTPDLEEVKQIIGDIPLVVDVSTAGSILVNAFPHADVVIESLTKTASGQGDVMMGAVILNPASRYNPDLKEELPERIEQPYVRDVQRLAYEITDWRQRTSKAGGNVLQLVDFFMGHDKVKDVFWTGNERSAASYSKLANKAMIHAGVITIAIKRSMRSMYDSLNLSKGPSFGTHFTLNTPYVQITHARDIATPEGRAMLQRTAGLNPRMLRISVGTEKADQLIEQYKAALKA